jgi:hypothetical protein
MRNKNPKISIDNIIEIWYKYFMRRILIGFIVFLYISFPAFPDLGAYSQKIHIEIESENYRIIHVHDWSLSTHNERKMMMSTIEQNPFDDNNNFAYIECINKNNGEKIFHIPSPALTHLFISDDEKYILGISRIMLDNPYQLIVITITGELLKKRHISSSEAIMEDSNFNDFKNKFPNGFHLLQSKGRIYYIEPYYFIDFLSMNMPVFLGDEAFHFLLDYIGKNHLSNNFSSSVTNWILWFSETDPNISFNYINNELYSIGILDPKKIYIEILINEHNI